MTKFIAIIGTLDTKSDQVEYLKKLIQERGHQTTIIDVGVLGTVSCEATVTRRQVAQAAGSSLEEIIAFNHEGKAMGKMADGACKIVKELYSKGELDGIIAVGGSMGTSLTLKVMDVLPLSLPKLILSTIAYSPAINPDLLCNGVLMMSFVGGLYGTNEIAKRILGQAAAIISAAAEAYKKEPITKKKLIGITTLGMAASRYLSHFKPGLEKRGYEIAVFHATGMNTRTLEKAIEEGLISAVLDLRIGTELMSQVCGSLYAPGFHRLESAAKRRIPQVLSPAGIETCLWAPYKPLPPRFARRKMFEHNPLLIVFSTTTEEKMKVASIMAKKLNQLMGPTALILTTKSSPAVIAHGMSDPDGVRAFGEVLKRALKPDIKVVELDASNDDPEFADEAIRLLDEMVGSQRYQQ